MRVNRPVGPGPSSPRHGVGTGAAPTGFTLPAPTPAGALVTGGVAGVGLAGLLAVQAAGEQGERRRRAVRRGHDLLERLEELRLGLLDGSVPLASLRRLRLDLVRSEPVDEPVLREVLAAIDQRAAVELAKLELAVAPLRPTLSHDVALAPVGETLPPQLAHS